MSDIYSPPEADVTPEEAEVRYAGFWIRAVASLIDSIWIIALTFALGWMLYGSYYFSSTELVMGYGDFFISYVLPFILTVLFWAYKSATPGKMALGIKIVDAETFEKVSNGRLVIRYLGYYPSMLVLLLGFFWVAWDKRKQGWHDKLARTVVIRDR